MIVTQDTDVLKITVKKDKEIHFVSEWIKGVLVSRGIIPERPFIAEITYKDGRYESVENK